MSGPAPGSQCRVCRSPDSALINLALAEGKSVRAIAKVFGLGKDSVARHAAAQHPGVVIEKKDRPPRPPTGESELEQLQVLREQLMEQMDERPRSDTARELRQVHQRIAEISGADRPKSVTVVDVQGLPELISSWFVALEPFPEARAALLAVTPAELQP